MLGFIGDIHGDIYYLIEKVKQIQHLVTAVIQVGDCYPKKSLIKRYMKEFLALRVPIYWIDGNHEPWNDFYSLENDQLVKTAPNMFYVPRGTVMELDGKTIAFLGGAASVDKEIRLRQKMEWDARENIQPSEFERLERNCAGKKIDILVTHVPPQSVILGNFSNRDKRKYYGVPLDWTDPNAVEVQKVWERLGKPMMLCGHMHRTVHFESNSRILDACETFIYPNPYSVEVPEIKPTGILVVDWEEPKHYNGGN